MLCLVSLAGGQFGKWVWVKNRVTPWGSGKWKHGRFNLRSNSFDLDPHPNVSNPESIWSMNDPKKPPPISCVCDESSQGTPDQPISTILSSPWGWNPWISFLCLPGEKNHLIEPTNLNARHFAKPKKIIRENIFRYKPMGLAIKPTAQTMFFSL